MPQIIMRGIRKEDVQAVRRELVDELTVIVGCPRDYFTVELTQTVFVGDEGEEPGTPFATVYWFDRGQEVQDRTAEVIDRHLRRRGYPQVEVIFQILEEAKYYENGKHY